MENIKHVTDKRFTVRVIYSFAAQVVINKGIVLSALALFMTAQMVSTNIAVWIYAVVVETVENNNGSYIGTK